MHYPRVRCPSIWIDDILLLEVLLLVTAASITPPMPYICIIATGRAGPAAGRRGGPS